MGFLIDSLQVIAVIVVWVFALVLASGCARLISLWNLYRIPDYIDLPPDPERRVKWNPFWQHPHNPKRSYRYDPDLMLRPANHAWRPLPDDVQ